jgi:hypothetical protein
MDLLCLIFACFAFFSYLIYSLHSLKFALNIHFESLSIFTLKRMNKLIASDHVFTSKSLRTEKKVFASICGFWELFA